MLSSILRQEKSRTEIPDISILLLSSADTDLGALGSRTTVSEGSAEILRTAVARLNLAIFLAVHFLGSSSPAMYA